MSFEANATRRRALKAAAGTIIAANAAPQMAGAQEASPEPVSPEEGAIGQVLMQMGAGFATRDADMAASVYTDDAEWLNAFGDWIVGREQIHAKLVELFNSDEFDAGQIVGEPSGSLRILNETTAVGWTYQEIADQQVVGTGEVIPLRKNHSLAVLVKTEGTWLITAHMFMDENIVE